MSRSIDDLYRLFQPYAVELVAKAKQAGFQVVITETLRTMEEQARLYAQGRTTDGKIVTMARPGESPHNHGLAFDVAFYDAREGLTWEGPWAKLGALGESIGLEWGGRWKFKDMPHFQMPNWRQYVVIKTPALKRGSKGDDVRELQQLINKASRLDEDGKFGPGTEAAIKCFQEANELPVTGTATPEVWAALRKNQ